jgi:hypothetical protein
MNRLLGCVVILRIKVPAMKFINMLIICSSQHLLLGLQKPFLGIHLILAI